MDEGNLELSAVGSMLSCDERNAWVKLLLGPPQDGIRPVWSTLAIVGQLLGKFSDGIICPNQ